MLDFGAIGILDGRKATTHWRQVERLRRGYRAVEVQPDALFVRDGQIVTSAGVGAGIDPALAIVEEGHGRETADR